ncbi:MAG: lamin tail domain-containing protein [Crocinitomicaceae bacterium]|nr:lamin tail domain-containing protein [Flavobacteriales bacterium]NQZ36371.1 lamin tail domain-containing protein [Crocinitomicaceae bacterium]
MRHFLSVVFFLTQLTCFGQIFDDFTDGNFTSTPAWGGTDADYTINGSNQLQLNNVGAATSYLSTAHNLANLDNKEWKFWTRQAFSPSSGNFGRIYLTSSNADLSTDPDGFYLQLGESGTTDAVRLFKVVGGTDTELTAGPSGQISTSFTIGIRVVRDNLGNWSLYIDPAGGTNFGLVGSATDATNLLGTHSGMLNVYTSSNATSFYYDDIYVGDEVLDLTPPVLISATVINANQIDVLFDEALDQTSAEAIGNYSISPDPGIISATLDGSNLALVHLVTSTALLNGQNYDLTTTGIVDVASNVSGAQITNFAFLIAETPLAGDVVINEVMFDETPSNGQPLVEYVEIYNRSTKIFNVEDWQLGDAASNGTITPNWLLPDSYMILTKTSGVDSFTVATGVTSFPSLNNTGDNVLLRSDTGLTLDSITYSDEWWNDASIIGGVSIERINPNDPCSDANDWTASTNASGGTPGAQNSVFDPTPDTADPELSFLFALTPNFLEIHYNEGMDSTSLANATFVITPSLTVQNNYVLSSPADMQILEFIENLTGSQTYTIEIQNVGDCWLNMTTLSGEFALPEIAESGDLVINEVLVDPVSGGKDWIEIYNNSDKLIDLFNYQIADFDDDTIANFKIIDQHILIGADEYIVLGEDISQIGQYYSSVVPDNLYETDLPSYSNDSGTVYLIHNNVVMDRVAYNDDWHFQLLDNTDGVSLERIDPIGSSSDGNNWHSAAEAIGFGTPGLVNSQFYPAIANGEFNYTNDVVSPDSDGYQDVLQINYEMIEAGYVGHFTVYDDRGRLITRVVESELLGASGTFTWGGVKEDGTKASIGTYVGVFEAFQLEGGIVFIKRKAFVVAGKI